MVDISKGTQCILDTSQSHAGAVVRFGTVMFGIVYVAHLTLELIAIIEEKPGWQFNTIRIFLA